MIDDLFADVSKMVSIGSVERRLASEQKKLLKGKKK